MGDYGGRKPVIPQSKSSDHIALTQKMWHKL